ncbi:hypothetical protein GCM10010483_69990 [Actinokineospora diospyrosa]
MPERSSCRERETEGRRDSVAAVAVAAVVTTEVVSRASNRVETVTMVVTGRAMTVLSVRAVLGCEVVALK